MTNIVLVLYMFDHFNCTRTMEPTFLIKYLSVGEWVQVCVCVCVCMCMCVRACVRVCVRERERERERKEKWPFVLVQSRVCIYEMLQHEKFIAVSIF